MSKTEITSKPASRHLEVVDARYRREHDHFHHLECAPIYQSKTTGKSTTDINDALIDPYGMPICRGYSKDEFRVKNTKKAPLSFNPKDPTARLRAFEMRAKMNDIQSSPTDYSDKFEVIQYVNNVSNIFSQKYKKYLDNGKHK